MSKFFRVLFFVVFIVIVSAGTASAYEYYYKDVVIYDGSDISRHRSSSDNVEALLIEHDITLLDKDVINHPLDAEVTSGMEVKIERGFHVFLITNNEQEIVKVENGTLPRNLINTLPKLENSEYVYEGKYSIPLEKNQRFELKIKTTELSTIKEDVPFEVEKIEDNSIFEGTEEVKTQGILGEMTIVTEASYIDGVIVGEKQIVSNEITLAPINQVIAVGTKKQNVVSTSKGDFTYSKILNMRATAYTNGLSETGKSPGDAGYGITRSGTVARVGSVAVDPRVIPLGTRLYVEGYGYAVAEDTGGAIKGNKIDLFYNTHSEANNFGRKSLAVYILE